MHARSKVLSTFGVLTFVLFPAAAAPQPAPPKQIDLAGWFDAGKLRAVNRAVSKLPDRADAVHVSEGMNPGIVWIQGLDLTQGTIEVDVRGRDEFQRSFLGIAFHGKDDKSYEAVYLRPFNFRTPDPARRHHAVQYVALPDFDWSRLRELFPGEFEAPVNSSMSPTEWVSLRVVVQDRKIQIYVGTDKTPALEARKLEELNRGTIGLWTGNGSDGDFANLRITLAK